MVLWHSRLQLLPNPVWQRATLAFLAALPCNHCEHRNSLGAVLRKWEGEKGEWEKSWAAQTI